MKTLLLQRSDVAALLDIDECMYAVEHAFKLYSEGKIQPPGLLGLHAESGGFHIKAGFIKTMSDYFVAKLNANFPANPHKHGLPTIQGVLALNSARNGSLLALMDSTYITMVRTGAATGIATRYLALSNAAVITICGCGNQGKISLYAILKVRPIKKVFAFDTDQNQTEKFAKEFSGKLKVTPIDIDGLSEALQQSTIVVTCTPSRKPFIHRKDISPGTFIAAVGADSEDKQELFSDLTASSKIIVDLLDQCSKIGELHHAIEDGLVTPGYAHGELGHVIAGKKTGRDSENEIIIFDSTGTALQDAAAAAIVYEKAISGSAGHQFDFAELETYVIGESP